MSAYVVSRSHIATLAHYALGGSHRISNRWGDMLALANMLAAENAKSVAYRYQEAESGFQFSSAQQVVNFARYDLARNPVAILKAIQCLKYQSCEHPGWQESEAKLALSHIQSAAIRELPGYDEAEGWSIDDVEEKPRATLVVLKQGGVQ